MQLSTAPSPVETGRGSVPVPLRAVVVDDCEDIRDILRMLFTRAGHEIVAEASDGASGVAAAKLTCPDVVVLDLDMPVMNGFDALPLVRAAVPGVKVVVYSHDVGYETTERLLDLGAHAWLRKGAPLAEVLAVVASTVFAG
jgi:DNA-binding NarL/FixJ family response regulator